MSDGTCVDSICEGSVFARERCRKHYNRDRHAGLLPPLTLKDKFWAKVDKTEYCWNWTGTLWDGYGRHNQTRAHRLSYELLVGPIPAGIEIDHACRNRRCVNPDHLRPATRKQNAENIDSHQDCSSGVRGVHWDSARRKWVVLVTHNLKVRYFGGYDTVAEAEVVAIEKRNELFTHNDLDRQESA